MNGFNIPRDASQQIKEGITVDSLGIWTNLEEGDLMFFGYERDGRLRIDHVAMWIGNNKFIQASKNVRVNSVIENSEDYDEYHMKKYILTKRYLGNITDGIRNYNFSKSKIFLNKVLTSKVYSTSNPKNFLSLLYQKQW